MAMTNLSGIARPWLSARFAFSVAEGSRELKGAMPQTVKGKRPKWGCASVAAQTKVPQTAISLVA
jgi:hypothetical protein